MSDKLTNKSKHLNLYAQMVYFLARRYGYLHLSGHRLCAFIHGQGLRTGRILVRGGDFFLQAIVDAIESNVNACYSTTKSKLRDSKKYHVRHRQHRTY